MEVHILLGQEPSAWMEQLTCSRQPALKVKYCSIFSLLHGAPTQISVSLGTFSEKKRHKE